MPKAKESHLKHQIVFSFHMHKDKQNVNYRQLLPEMRNSYQKSKNFFLSSSSFQTVLFSVFKKIASKAENGLTNNLSWGGPSAVLPRPPQAVCH